MITWPDFTFPPINLWNAPRIKIRENPLAYAVQKPEKPSWFTRNAQETISKILQKH